MGQTLNRVRWRRPHKRLALLPALIIGVLLLAACEKPDASDTTSPSAIILVGTTTGNVAYNLTEMPPAEVADPAGWDYALDNARFSELENGQPSIQVAAEVKSKPGPGLELWLADKTHTIWKWSGGSAREYNGVVCFQIRLVDKEKGEALPLERLGDYTFTMAFRDPGSGEVVASKTIKVAGLAPTPQGSAPTADSKVGKDLLGCPRSVI